MHVLTDWGVRAISFSDAERSSPARFFARSGRRLLRVLISHTP